MTALKIILSLIVFVFATGYMVTIHERNACDRYYPRQLTRMHDGMCQVYVDSHWAPTSEVLR